MKKSLLIILLLLGTFLHVQAQNNATLVLWHPDGKTTDVELFTQPRVQFLNDSVFITSTVLDLKYEAKDILRFSYKGNGTGISLPQSETTTSHSPTVIHNSSGTHKSSSITC